MYTFEVYGMFYILLTQWISNLRRAYINNRTYIFIVSLVQIFCLENFRFTPDSDCYGHKEKELKGTHAHLVTVYIRSLLLVSQVSSL